MARVTFESGGERREHRVAGAVVIGRLRSNPIFIDDKLLSREHTKIYFDGKRYFVEDMESKNGTFLNGTLIKKPELLHHGDVIKSGPYLFKFELDPAEQGVASQPVHATPAHVPPAPAPPAAKFHAPPTPHPRPRPPAEEEPSAVASFFLWVILVPVFGVATFLFKAIFCFAFDRLPPK